MTARIVLCMALPILMIAACEQSPEKHDYHGGTEDLPGIDLAGVDDITVDIAPADLPPGADVPLEDTVSPNDALPTDQADGILPEELLDETADQEVVDPPLGCGDVLISYAAAPGVQEVLASGSFNGWGDSAETADPLGDDDGDGTWTLMLHLAPGKHLYKLIVDGEWILDPANPDQEDDGNGNMNSVLWVEECPSAGDLVLEFHDTDSDAGTFSARLAATGDEPIDDGAIEVTVDWEVVPGGTIAVTEGGSKLELELTGLADGIHDVRIDVDGEVYLLKVYIGVSTDWRDVILYFVMTDRFSNGDPGNDQPVEGVDWRTNYQGGDFKGVMGRINQGYFDDLGVGAIWLSWPVDNPDGYHDGGRPSEHYCGMDPKTAPMTGTQYTGYHGYWPSNLYETEEHFGTMQELQELVGAAHAHGIRILLDFTANHVHDSSPFFQQHTEDGFFHFPVEICQDVGWDNKPITCWFTDYLPDLNYSNPAAVQEVLDYAVWWAKESGCDGFRLDAVKHIEFEFITQLRSRVKQELELTGIDFYIVGETFTGDAGLIQSFIGPDKIHGQFDFPANAQILGAFAREEKGLKEMDQAVRAAKAVYGPGALMSNFIGNHDIARFISQASFMIDCGVWDVVSNIAQGWNNPPGEPPGETPYRKLELAFTYIMTIPGIPLIYYGDEFGLPGAGDPDNRRMMRFDDDLSDREKTALAYLKKLGQIRNAHPSLSRGEWTEPLWEEGSFLAYGRTLPGERSVVLINMGTTEKSGDLGMLPTAIPNGSQMEDLISGATATVSDMKLPFSVPAKTAAIFVTK